MQTRANTLYHTSFRYLLLSYSSALENVNFALQLRLRAILWHINWNTFERERLEENGYGGQSAGINARFYRTDSYRDSHYSPFSFYDFLEGFFKGIF